MYSLAPGSTPLMPSAATCLRHRLVDLALQPDEVALSSSRELLVELGRRHAEQLREPRELGLRRAPRPSGIAQMLGAGTLVASSRPLRSRMRPRLAGSSSVRAKRTSPCFRKKSLRRRSAPRPRAPSQHAEAERDQRRRGTSTAPDRRPAREQRAGRVVTLRTLRAASLARLPAASRWSAHAQPGAPTPRGADAARHVLRDRRRRGAHRSCSRASLLDAQRRRLRALFDFSRSRSVSSAARLALRPGRARRTGGATRMRCAPGTARSRSPRARSTRFSRVMPRSSRPRA